MALYDQGRWLEALSGLFDLSEQHRLELTDEQAANVNLLIGNIYSSYNDYENAVRYCGLSLDAARRTSDSNLTARAAANAAVNASYMGSRDKADEYIQAFDKAASHSRSEYVPFMKSVVQAVYERKFGSSAEAISLMKNALAMCRSGQVDAAHAVAPLSELSEMYVVAGAVDSAMHYLRLTEVEAARNHQLHVSVECMRLYKSLYQQRGMVDSALIFEQRHFMLRDSLLNSERFISLSGSNTAARDERNTARIEGLSTLVNRQWSALIVALLVIVSVTTAVVIIVLQKRRLSQAYRALWEKNGELESLRRRARSAEAAAPVAVDAIPGSSDLQRRIMAVMEEGHEWLNPDFSLQMLADLTESNTKYVSQVINDVYGKNFRAFINDYRIREARRLMAAPDTADRLTLQTIGENVGFRSASNFIAAFKRQTGLTPSIYMKMQAEECENRTETSD